MYISPAPSGLVVVLHGAVVVPRVVVEVLPVVVVLHGAVVWLHCVVVVLIVAVVVPHSDVLLAEAPTTDYTDESVKRTNAQFLESSDPILRLAHTRTVSDPASHSHCFLWPLDLALCRAAGLGAFGLSLVPHQFDHLIVPGNLLVELHRGHTVCKQCAHSAPDFL